MGAKEEPYPSSVTDKEWAIVEPLLGVKGKLGRPPRYSRRVMLDAILYVVRSGCTWRMMPKHFPHWRLVYYYFAKWQEQGVWQRLNDTLRDRVRVKAGKKKAPTAAIIDSQSIKLASQPGERGFDAGKKIRGRKRHLLVDTMGLILGCRVHHAGLQDRDGAKLLEPFLLRYGWLRKLFVDGGYAGRFLEWLAALPRHRKIHGEVIRKIHPHHFEVLPRRWVVERTFAWLGNFRRLSKDYESKTEHSEAMIYLASSYLMLRRLSKSRSS